MKVLIAEDDAVSRRLLEAFLTKWGYEIVVAQNGPDAWQALQEENAPRLAILDWMMPGLEGTEICRRVRQRTGHPYAYLLLLTAKAQKKDLLQGLAAGADDYLSKPFDAGELRARLQVGERILKLEDDLIAARDALRFQATHDILTGLNNRAEILEVLGRELSRSHRDGSSVGVILADIDHFKRVNDTLGHLAGDMVLRETARRMSSAVRSYDFVGRYGGEEFIVIVPASDVLGTLAQAERIRTAIEGRPVEVPDDSISVTISLGVAAGGGTLLPESKRALEAQALISEADAALYRAKDLGRNRVEVAIQPASHENVSSAPLPELEPVVKKP